MYFHPRVLHPAQKEQIANAFGELADILIDGVDRQRCVWKRSKTSAMLRKATSGHS